MFIAMNRFKVLVGREKEFEDVWRTRDSFLGDVPGFLGFHLLRAATGDEHTLYSSHSTWEDQVSFENWTRSESFRKAHSGASSRKKLYLGHPEFEGFTVII
ncbi:MAG: antibiotic biosynthesis monooxygenase [Pseudomonadota bacterium]|nr:antibiotic biosynthesis monooxygenase [Pseudomonadota bacterium]